MPASRPSSVWTFLFRLSLLGILRCTASTAACTYAVGHLKHATQLQAHTQQCHQVSRMQWEPDDLYHLNKLHMHLPVLGKPDRVTGHHNVHTWRCSVENVSASKARQASNSMTASSFASGWLSLRLRNARSYTLLTHSRQLKHRLDSVYALSNAASHTCGPALCATPTTNNAAGMPSLMHQTQFRKRHGLSSGDQVLNDSKRRCAGSNCASKTY